MYYPNSHINQVLVPSRMHVDSGHVNRYRGQSKPITRSKNSMKSNDIKSEKCQSQPPYRQSVASLKGISSTSDVVQQKDALTVRLCWLEQRQVNAYFRDFHTFDTNIKSL